jgi:hypothetical protein
MRKRRSKEEIVKSAVESLGRLLTAEVNAFTRNSRALKMIVRRSQLRDIPRLVVTADFGCRSACESDDVCNAFEVRRVRATLIISRVHL